MFKLFGELGDLAAELCSNSKRLLLKSSDIFSKSKLAIYSQKIKHDAHISKEFETLLKVLILKFHEASYLEIFFKIKKKNHYQFFK